MSDKDLSRYKVINDVCERRLRRADAAEILNLSERQVQRLMNRLRQSGAASLVHGARGKPSNNDGSHHDWFEGRSPKCCLLVYIDDATGRLMNLRFSDT
ncbi:helix-turn-helix domain-containing protein, partial [Vibrio vulnificus]